MHHSIKGDQQERKEQESKKYVWLCVTKHTLTHRENNREEITAGVVCVCVCV